MPFLNFLKPRYTTANYHFLANSLNSQIETFLTSDMIVKDASKYTLSFCISVYARYKDFLSPAAKEALLDKMKTDVSVLYITNDDDKINKHIDQLVAKKNRHNNYSTRPAKKPIFKSIAEAESYDSFLDDNSNVPLSELPEIYKEKHSVDAAEYIKQSSESEDSPAKKIIKEAADSVATSQAAVVPVITAESGTPKSAPKTASQPKSKPAPKQSAEDDWDYSLIPETSVTATRKKMPLYDKSAMAAPVTVTMPVFESPAPTLQRKRTLVTTPDNFFVTHPVVTAILQRAGYERPSPVDYVVTTPEAARAANPYLMSQSTIDLLQSLKKGGKAKKKKKSGSGIHINPKNEGKFSEKASRAGMGVQEYASHVLANKDSYDSSTVRQANFARNAKKWKHQEGGVMYTSMGPGDGSHYSASMSIAEQSSPRKKNALDFLYSISKTDPDSIADWNDESYRSSRKMAWTTTTDENGDKHYWVFPIVQTVSGRSVDYSDPSNSALWDGFDHFFDAAFDNAWNNGVMYEVPDEETAKKYESDWFQSYGDSISSGWKRPSASERTDFF